MARPPEATAPAPAGADHRVVFQYTAEDLTAAQHLFFRTNLRRPRTRKITFGIWLTAVVIFTVIMLQAGRMPWGLFFVTTLAAAIGVVAIPWLIVRLFAPAGARRTLRTQITLAGTHVYHWDDTALCMQSTHGTSRIPWSDFYEVAENDAMWLLFASENMYYLLPKRTLSPEQSRHFADCLQRGRATLPDDQARA